MLLSEMSQDLDYLMQQIEDERAMMIHRFKEGYNNNDSVSANNEIGGFDFQFKKRKTELKKNLLSSNQVMCDRMALNSIKQEKQEESEGSCEVIQQIDGGTGARYPHQSHEDHLLEFSGCWCATD